MASSAGVARQLLLASFLSVLALFGGGAEANANSSVINARVCQANAQPKISITAPASDTLVRQNTITLKGSVQLVNQVDVLINKQYARTLAIAQGSSTFETGLALPQGTSTVSVEGVGMCNGVSVNDKIVVTFQPSPPRQGHSERPDDAVLPPSFGYETPTVINPDMPGDTETDRADETDQNRGGVVVSQPEDKSDSPATVSQSWWQSFIASSGILKMLSWLERAFDMNFSIFLTKDGSTQSNFEAIVRLAAVLWGLLLLVFGRHLLFFVSKIRALELSKRRLLDISIRLTGAVLIIASIVIL